MHAEFDGVPYDGSIVNMGVRNAGRSICCVIGVLKSIRASLHKSDGDSRHILVRGR